MGFLEKDWHLTVRSSILFWRTECSFSSANKVIAKIKPIYQAESQ
jgi:hypothetical protein